MICLFGLHFFYMCWTSFHSYLNFHRKEQDVSHKMPPIFKIFCENSSMFLRLFSCLAIGYSQEWLFLNIVFVMIFFLITKRRRGAKCFLGQKDVRLSSLNSFLNSFLICLFKTAIWWFFKDFSSEYDSQFLNNIFLKEPKVLKVTISLSRSQEQL